jgi:hypothetical protein
MIVMIWSVTSFRANNCIKKQKRNDVKMKKGTTLLILLIGVMIRQPSDTIAQNSKFTVGGGFIYSMNNDQIGYQIHSRFNVADRMQLAPKIGAYFQGFSSTFCILEMDLHYLFIQNSEIDFYGFTGPYLTNIGIDFFSDTNTQFGFFLGSGVEYYLDRFSIYGELKYGIGDLDSIIIDNVERLIPGIGIRVAL